MNCLCNPPKPSVTRICSKEGQNKGREFFCCDQQVNGCNLFHWVGAHMPFSLSHRAKQSVSSNGVITAKKPGVAQATILLHKFETGPPKRVWFSITCPMNTTLTKFFTSLNQELRQYLNGLKLWVFDFALYEEIVCKLLSPEFQDTLQLVELPRFLSVGLRKYLNSISKTSQYESVLNLEPVLSAFLLPFQLEGIKYVVRQGGRALIGDEMGCGKTVQAIGVLQHYRRYWPALVMMPVILCKQWHVELMKFSASILSPQEVVVLQGGGDKVPPGVKVVIVPYSILDTLVERKRLTPQQFGVVIADESHNLKSIGAKRTESALPFLKAAVVALCMTGTPLPNRPMELYTQLNGLLPLIFNDVDAFGRRYCDPKPSRFSAAMEYKGSCNESELKMILEGLVMIRRLKEDVVKSLPTKSRELRYVTPEGQQLGEIGRIQKRMPIVDEELKAFDLSNEKKVALQNEQRSLLQRYYQVTGMSKIKAIREELFRLIDETRLERAQAESKATEASVSNVSLAEESAVTTGNSSSGSSSHSLSAVIDLRDNEEQEGKVSSFNALDDDTLSVPRSRSDSLSSQDGDRVGSVKKMRTEVTTTTVSSLAPSGMVLMELEDDLVTEILPSRDSILTYGTKPLGVRDTTEEVELLCDSEEGEEDIVRSVGNKRKRRLQHCGDEALKSKHINNIGTMSSPISKATRLTRSSSAVKKKPVRKSILLTSTESDDASSDTEFDDDDRSDYEEDGVYELIQGEELESIAAIKRGVNGTSKATQSRRSKSVTAVKSAFDEMKSASAGSSSVVKPNRGKKSTKVESSAVTFAMPAYSGLGKKIIVFVHHMEVMNAVDEALRELDVQFIRIDGQVSGPKRNKLIQQFQEDDITDVALLSITACGTGLNLTRANVALFGELYWSPGSVLQAEDRIHRLGQKSETVRIIYLVARNTADDIVWEQIQKKHNVVGATVGITDHKTGGRGMTIGKRQNEREKGTQGTMDQFVVGDKLYGKTVAQTVGTATQAIPNVSVPNPYAYVPFNPSAALKATESVNGFHGNHGMYPVNEQVPTAVKTGVAAGVNSGSDADFQYEVPDSQRSSSSATAAVTTGGLSRSTNYATSPTRMYQQQSQPPHQRLQHEQIHTQQQVGYRASYQPQQTTYHQQQLPATSALSRPYASNSSTSAAPSTVLALVVAPPVTTAVELTVEMRERMERNRLQALEKRAAALRRQQQQQEEVEAMKTVVPVAVPSFSTQHQPQPYHNGASYTGSGQHVKSDNNGNTVYTAGMHSANNGTVDQLPTITASSISDPYGPNRYAHNPAVNMPPSFIGLPTVNQTQHHIPQQQQQPYQPHVFTTGRGNNVSTTELGIQRADKMFS